MSKYIFRRRPKDGNNYIFYQNMNTGYTWIIADDGYDTIKYINLWELPDSEYHPIEPYTGVKDKNGVMIFAGDILTSHLYLYQGNGYRNYDGIVCWSDETVSFFILLKCVNPDIRGISHGLSHSFGEFGEPSIIYEVIDSIGETDML